MNLRPRTGMVLVEVLPNEEKSDGGLFLPDIAHDAARGERHRPITAKVVAIGTWPKAKNGFSRLPDFGIGATVIVSPYAGTKLGRLLSERHMLVRNQDVLAVVS